MSDLSIALQLAELKVLLSQLVELDPDFKIEVYSEDKLQKLSAAEITSVVRELKDLMRTLGGVRRR